MFRSQLSRSSPTILALSTDRTETGPKHRSKALRTASVISTSDRRGKVITGKNGPVLSSWILPSGEPPTFKLTVRNDWFCSAVEYTARTKIEMGYLIGAASG